MLTTAAQVLEVLALVKAAMVGLGALLLFVAIF